MVRFHSSQPILNHRRLDLSDSNDRYAPDNKWFIETMNSVFDLGGILVDPTLSSLNLYTLT